MHALYYAKPSQKEVTFHSPDYIVFFFILDSRRSDECPILVIHNVLFLFNLTSRNSKNDLILMGVLKLKIRFSRSF